MEDVVTSDDMECQLKWAKQFHGKEDVARLVVETSGRTTEIPGSDTDVLKKNFF